MKKRNWETFHCFKKKKKVFSHPFSLSGFYDFTLLAIELLMRSCYIYPIREIFMLISNLCFSEFIYILRVYTNLISFTFHKNTIFYELSHEFLDDKKKKYTKRLQCNMNKFLSRAHKCLFQNLFYLKWDLDWEKTYKFFGFDQLH